MDTISGKQDVRMRIIVCCDGTACTPYKGNEECPLTNVSRISRAINPITATGCRQVVYYQPGVGTAAASSSNILAKGLGKGLL
jgi:uncharacterized protein (DUF2235 family)